MSPQRRLSRHSFLVRYSFKSLNIAVPFIDTQPVEAKIPKPLIGAGVYYKTTPGYGGKVSNIYVAKIVNLIKPKN